MDSFHETLQRVGKKRFQLVHSTTQLHGHKLALAILARQIALFLAEANLNYLRRCANTTSCVLYFYDTTKNHRRQWCSTGVCGNRHKVAEFRKRHALMRTKTVVAAALSSGAEKLPAPKKSPNVIRLPSNFH